METELAKIVKNRIRSQGPLTFRDFMSLALYDEAHGFYSRGPKIGSPEGPFNTNAQFPAFGFAIAQAIELAEKKLGYPLRILELGGGTGQLGKTILSFLQHPHEYIILEISHGLRAIQEQHGLQAIQTLKHLVPCPTFVFGNEVLDALPVHRVMGMENSEIMELYVDLDKNGEFLECSGPPSTLKLSERLGSEGIQLGRGQVAEICLELETFFGNLCQVLEQGYVILVDYGDMASHIYSYRHRNGTLRSYYQQEQIHDPFFAVGHQDLTADVDYTAAFSAAEQAGFESSGPLQQGTWLRNVGIELYGESSGERQSAQRELDILIRPAGLGSTFDVLIFKTPGLPDGPGLHPRHQ